MAYLRGRTYIYSDGENMHINDETVPLEDIDAFVAMHWARLGEEGRSEAVRLAVEKGEGNFGADALFAELGLPTSMEWVKAVAERLGEAQEHASFLSGKDAAEAIQGANEECERLREVISEREAEIRRLREEKP